jgi:GNAT superfamily N-acetyltransferase
MADDSIARPTIDFETLDPLHPDAVWALGEYFAELDRRFPGGFDPGDATESDADRFRSPMGCFVVVRTDTVGREPIGCAGLQTIAIGVGELKRMWIAPSKRGRGLGRELLVDIERRSADLGHHTMRLDTNANLPEAVALYQSAGYRRIARYNDNPYPDFFFEKRLSE